MLWRFFFFIYWKPAGGAALPLSVRHALFTHSVRVWVRVWDHSPWFCISLGWQVFLMWGSRQSEHYDAAHSLCTSLSSDTPPPTSAALLGAIVIPKYCVELRCSVRVVVSTGICSQRLIPLMGSLSQWNLRITLPMFMPQACFPDFNMESVLVVEVWTSIENVSV